MKAIILVVLALCIALALAQPDRSFTLGNVVYNYAKSYDQSSPKVTTHVKRGNGSNACSTTLGDASYTQITNCVTLGSIGNGLALDGCYVLTQGISCTSFNTIQGVFTGTLYGATKLVSQLTKPIFSEIGVGGFVSDVTIDAPTIAESSNTHIGALARIVRGGFVRRVFVVGTASIESNVANGWVGAIVGEAREGAFIDRCVVNSATNVEGTGTDSKVGGVVGGLTVFSIANITTSSANVVGNGLVGCIAGVTDGGSTILNTLAPGDCTADNTPTPSSRRMKRNSPITAGAGGVTGSLSDGSSIQTTSGDATIQAKENGGRITASCDPSSSVENTFTGQDSDFNVDGSAVPDVPDMTPAANGGIAFDPDSYDQSTFINAGFSPDIFDFSGGGAFPTFTPSANGATVNDPHFFPLWKSNPRHLKYTVFSGIKGAVYNIITHPELQWNAKFDTYRHLPYNWAHPEYVVAAGFLVKHPTGEKDASVIIRPATYQGTSFFTGNVEVLVNGKVVEQGVRHHYFGNEHDSHYVYPFTTRHVYMATEILKLKYHLQFITDNFLHDPKRMAQALEGRPTARWPLLNSAIVAHDEIESAHGLLGQTARLTSPYKPPVQDCFSCFVEGKVSDYRLRHDNILGIHFKYNEYQPSK